MGTVTALRRAPAPATGYTQLSTEARLAFAGLKGRIGALERIFAGGFASAVSAAEITRLCEDVRIEAQRVSRLAR